MAAGGHANAADARRLATALSAQAHVAHARNALPMNAPPKRPN